MADAKDFRDAPEGIEGCFQYHLPSSSAAPVQKRQLNHEFPWHIEQAFKPTISCHTTGSGEQWGSKIGPDTNLRSDRPLGGCVQSETIVYQVWCQQNGYIVKRISTWGGTYVGACLTLLVHG